MFSPTPDPSRSAPRSLRAAIRDAADLVVAFVTLEGYGLDDLRPDRPASSVDHTGAPADAAAARTGSSRAEPAAAGPKHPHSASLRIYTRTRRPGTTPRTPQLCTTPLRASETRQPASTAPRRRTAPQDAAA